jgi:hypothetical protein
VTLTRTQIADYARQAGFPESTINIAVAIALAESGGRADARCNSCAGVAEDSRGLWQINIRAHPEYSGVDLTDPLANAKAALSISKGGKTFTPWSTFTSGAYRKFLSAESSVIGTASSALNSFSGHFSIKPVSKATTRAIIYGTTALLVFFVLVNLMKGR